MSDNRHGSEGAHTCIYCGAVRPSSDEHVLPACLGKFRGSSSLYDRICATCNNKIGTELEEEFCRSYAGLFRAIVGVRGRKRKTKVSAFYRRSVGLPPVTMFGKDPSTSHDFQILWEINPGTKTIRQLRQIVVRDHNGDIHTVPIPRGCTSVEYVRRRLEEEGVTEFSVVTGYSEAEGQEELEALLKELTGAREVRWSLSASESQSIQVVAKATITDRTLRAVAKILFHYLLREFSQFTGSEPAFAPIKNFIMEGGAGSEFMYTDSDRIVEHLKEGAVLRHYGHILAVEKEYNRIRGKARFFVGPDYRPWCFHVLLGRNPERLDFPESKGHLFLYFDEKDDEGYDGEMEEMSAVPRRRWWTP